MHTSLEVRPRTHCVSCEGACPTVPSPLVGEGQGEGWRRTLSARLVSSTDSQTMAGSIYWPQHETDAVRVVPLSLSLPHKGGRNAVALLCPTADTTCVHSCTCVHALARRERGGVRGYRLSRDPIPHPNPLPS